MHSLQYTHYIVWDANVAIVKAVKNAFVALACSLLDTLFISSGIFFPLLSSSPSTWLSMPDFFVFYFPFHRTHMQDLKDVTNNVHYENYRSKKLAAVTCNGVDTTKTKGQLTKYVLVTQQLHISTKENKTYVAFI